MMMKALLVVGLAVATLMGAAPVMKAQEKSQPEQNNRFSTLLDKLEHDPAIKELWQSCPADLYRSRSAFWSGFLDNPRVKTAQCQADPLWCHTACFQYGNDNACFSLALALQLDEKADASHYSEPLFTRACATGSAGGCTNRGGGIRNGNFDNDPFAAKPESERNACLFRTFEIACQSGDAWGCAMHGQSYQYGEGVAENPDKAAEFFRKSCAISPDFVACDFAKRHLKEIGVSL